MHWTLPFRSLRVQLALAFSVPLVLLAVALSVALGAMVTGLLQRTQGLVLQTNAHNAARVLADGLMARSREIAVIAASDHVWAQGLGSDHIRSMLARMQAHSPDNTWIGVSDSGGTIRAATADLLVGANARSRSWFQAGSVANYVGDVHPAFALAAHLPPANDGETLRFLDFAAPIVSGGAIQGVLISHGSWAWADQVITRLAAPNADAEAIETFIFDRAGKMIYAPGRMLALHRSVGQTAPPADPQAHVRRWADGGDYLTAVEKLPADSALTDMGWTIVSRQPADVAFAAASHSRWRALQFGLVATLLAMALAWFVAGAVSRPLVQIANAARRVESRTPGSGIPLLRTSSEVEQLSTALSEMTAGLQEANGTLEERVRLRTAELEAANLRLEMMASCDPLTGLLNRRAFGERLGYAVSTARRTGGALSLVMVDIDHFKRINDTHGHSAGDAALVQVAKALRHRLRETDPLARIGGEEFIVLLPDTDAPTARHVAAQLIDAIGALDLPQVGRVTVSCGVTRIDAMGDDGSHALRRVDEALYLAKHNGRNRAEFLDSGPGQQN